MPRHGPELQPEGQRARRRDAVRESQPPGSAGLILILRVLLKLVPGGSSADVSQHQAAASTRRASVSHPLQRQVMQSVSTGGRTQTVELGIGRRSSPLLVAERLTPEGRDPHDVVAIPDP